MNTKIRPLSNVYNIQFEKETDINLSDKVLNIQPRPGTKIIFPGIYSGYSRFRCEDLNLY
jgi:hypothetical protein